MKEHEELLKTPFGVERNAEYFREVKGFTAIPNNRVEEIDRERKVVRALNLKTGEEAEFPYDKLVLATGGSPVVPSFEGVELGNIFRLKTIEDGVAIKKYVETGNVRKAVVVGAGLIGLEMVESFKQRGLTVVVVELLDSILPALFDRDMGLLIESYLKSEGVEIHTSERVVRLVGDDHGNVKTVITDRGELAADTVLIAVGLRPVVELAKKAGLAIGTTNAIKVNEFLQTSDPDIYAGGDCVENVYWHSDRKVYTPLGSVANKHGRIIADHIAGKKDSFPGVSGTVVWKVLNMNIARTGLTERDAQKFGYEVETVICPSPDRPHYYPGASYVLVKLIADRHSGKLLGAQIIGPGDVVQRINVVVSVLRFEGTVSQLSTLDLAYAPPFAPAMDAIITAANVMLNKLEGLAKALSPLKVKEKLDRGDDVVLLDVRSPQEYESVRIDDPRVTLLPLGKLRREWRQLPREKEIIAFCGASLRGYEAQKILENKGFTDVKFMDGGLAAWPFEKFVKSS